MQNEILELSKKFISIESVSENSKALSKILKLALSYLQEYTIEIFTKDGIESALVYNSKDRPKKFKVILNGHLDVIPGKKHQYKPKIIGDKLYGVGSMDMKSNISCFIHIYKNLAKKLKYPLALQLVTDEQNGSICGTKYQIDQGIRGEFIISGETSNFNIVNQAKGILWLQISAKGKSAHSAYPWQGINAILKMNKFINELIEKYPLPESEIWQTTVNISSIATNNNTFNKIPEDCKILLDIRYIPKEKNDILNTIKKLLHNDLDFEIIFEDPPVSVNKNNYYLKKLQKTAEEILNRKIKLHRAHGTSDITHYTQVGCPGVEFGPIGITGNSDNEYINIPSLESYCKILTKFLLNLNSNYM